MYEESTKPAILYHGSPHGEIEELGPRRESMRDPEEGPVLFATQDLAVATVFMFKSKHWGSGQFGDIPYAWIVETREEFIKKDKGGHIYVLPSDQIH